MTKKIIEKKAETKQPSYKKSHLFNGRNRPSSFNRTFHTLLEKSGNSTTAALGAAAIGLAGLIAFYLVNNRNKKRPLSKYLYDTYHEYKEDAEDVAHNMYEKGKELYDYTADYSKGIKNRANKVMKQPGALLLLGAVGGILAGGSLAYMVRRQIRPRGFFDKVAETAEAIKESAVTFSENVGSQDWIHATKEILETLNDHMGSEKKSKSHSNFNVQNAIDLGLCGYKLWENFSKRK